MRRKNPARVLGPYEERNRWRLIVIEEGGRRSVFFPTHAEARKFKLGAEREIAQPASRSIADMLMEWHAQKVRAGQAKPKTVAHQLGRLQAFFAPVAEEDIAALTPRRAEMLYLDATQRVSDKTGTVLAAASHRLDLWAAQTFYRWAARQGHVGASPFRDVKPIGRVNAGKPQLRIEEARRFTQSALRYFEERLGHHSFAVTERHYAQRAAVANAATARVLGMMEGGRVRDRHEVQEQLKQLDDNTLARLLELLESEKKNGASN